ADTPDEFGILTRSFHDMADALTSGQQTLRENEARFRLLMDSIDALIYVADMTTYEVLFLNKYGKKTLGDISGKLCWQSIQQGQIGPCPFCTNKYLLDEKGNPREAYCWEFQNTVTGQWFYNQDRAIRWVDSRLVRLEVATDISERKVAEALLAEETERMVVTLRSIGDGVITTDTEGQVLLINKVAEMLTGWRCEDAAGHSLTKIFNIVNKETRQPCKNPLDRILASSSAIELAEGTILISKNGQERAIADSGAPIHDKNGAIIGMVLVFRDITEQLHTEQELLKIKKLESIGVLAGGIAHDFNNILAGILGNIDLSMMDSTITEKTRNFLKEAAKASWRARDLTQQLLTFAKGGHPIKEVVSLTDVIKDSGDFILRGDKVSCSYTFPDDLWLVDIDKSQINQVFQNIILNAINAMPSGGTIEISCDNIIPDARDKEILNKDSYVRVRITDNGVGIDPNLLDKIFDPYFSTKRQGSGLGLAITHSIINRHGGHISVESTMGVGTTFTIYLPASEQRYTPPFNSDAIELPLRKATILVMDDEEPVRNVTQAFLSRMGHQVLLAKDGAEAIQMYQESIDSNTPIDITIMDLTIPGGMGGEEAIQPILKINPNAMVIVSSGYSNNPIMANFKDYGFCDAIAKPYQLKELTTVIAQLLKAETTS
ncbi:MAG: ATP-binding protein, partial [Desulfobulbaceae bacterium]|nr:ATP-binding protein [Desulfobulbaceae bacterium]